MENHEHLTRSRFGRRTPWICLGAIGSLVSLIALGRVSSIPALLTAWAVYQVFLNSIIAPLLGTLSDRIAPRFRGSAASGYALGIGVGTGLGQVIGAQFLGNAATGFLVLGLLTVLVAPAASLFFREDSSTGMPKKAFGTDMILDHFTFARHNARDYYLALFGKFFVMVAKFAIQGYVLYILTDYMLVDEGSTKGYISAVSLIIMFLGIGMAFLSGPIADRLKMVKLPVVVSALFIATGVFAPFVVIAGGATRGVVLTQLLGVTSAALTLLTVRRDVEWREYLRLLPSSLAGLLLATMLAARLPDAQAQIVSSAIMLAILLIAPRVGRTASVSRNWISLSVAGSAAGAMTVLAGVGAAALTALQQATTWEHSRFVATLQPYLITISTLTVGARLAVSPDAWPSFSIGAWTIILASLFFGIRLGSVVAERLPSGAARRLTFGIAFLGAIIALLNGVMALR